MILSRFNDVNVFGSMLADCSVSRRQDWGHMTAIGTILDQIARCPAQRALPLMVIIVLLTMIFSRFKDVNLFCSMLADCSVSRSWV